MIHSCKCLRTFGLLSIAALAGCMSADDDDDDAPEACAPERPRPDAGTAVPTDGGQRGDAGPPLPYLAPPARIELVAVGAEKYRGKAAILDEQRVGDAVRVRFDPESGPRCLRGGDYAAFYLDRGAKDTVIMLEGGGACWSALCSAEENADETVRELALTQDEPGNPFRSWNLVFAPYCDGSVFWGDNQIGEDGGLRYHHGQQNLAAAFDLAEQHFANSERVLVAGFSAGGYGTLRGMINARLTFPNADLLVLNDSGLGAVNPEQSAAIEQRLAEWKFAPTIPGSCAACDEGRGHQNAMLAWLLERDRNVRIAFASYYEDPVIGKAFNGLDGAQFKTLLLQQTDPIASAHPERFKRFMLPGAMHVVMFGLPDVSAGGVKYADWLKGFEQDDPSWRDLLADRP